MRTEHLSVIHRPELVSKYRTAPDRNLATVETIIANAILIDPTSTPAICRDPGDDKFLAAAIAGSAQFLVSEDLDLLELGNVAGIPLMNAESILRLLEANR